MNMKKISSGDFQRNPGEYQDDALKSPLLITKHGKGRLVLMSVGEYEQLIKLSQKAISVKDLSDEQLDLIMSAKVPSEYDFLDKELDEE